MSISPAKSGLSSPRAGSFALVTYLPDPLRSFLSGLRQFLPGDPDTDAHITFLPPRPLSLSIEAASCEVQRVLQFETPFELDLGTVRMFAETGILYLSVEDGAQELLRLHENLNRGKLFAKECFEYIPHLTLGGPLPSGEIISSLRRAEQAWKNSAHSPRFLVTEVVFLWQPGSCAENNWQRIASYPLPLTPSSPSFGYSNSIGN